MAYSNKSLLIINGDSKKKEGNYTQDELKQYKIHTSIWGNLWIELHQEKGQTNYSNMKLSEHVCAYMVECGNLYKYSQQGWELFNSLIKRFFFLIQIRVVRDTVQGQGLFLVHACSRVASYGCLALQTIF